MPTSLTHRNTFVLPKIPLLVNLTSVQFTSPAFSSNSSHTFKFWPVRLTPSLLRLFYLMQMPTGSRHPRMLHAHAFEYLNR